MTPGDKAREIMERYNDSEVGEIVCKCSALLQERQQACHRSNPTGVTSAIPARQYCTAAWHPGHSDERCPQCAEIRRAITNTALAIAQGSGSIQFTTEPQADITASPEGAHTMTLKGPTPEDSLRAMMVLVSLLCHERETGGKFDKEVMQKLFRGCNSILHCVRDTDSAKWILAEGP